MNIDEFKQDWDQEGQQLTPVSTLEKLKSKSSPLAKIRRNILMEMLLMLTAVIIIAWAIYTHDYQPMTRVVVWATCLIGAINMGLYYVQAFKMYNQGRKVDLSEPKSVLKYIFNFKLSLAMYKVYNYSLMPFALIMGLAVGRGGTIDHLYSAYLEHGVSNGNLALFFLGFVAFNLLLYLMVNAVMKSLYSKHLDNLEEIMDDII